MLLSDGFSDKPFKVFVINSPTVLNSLNPNPRVVAACVPNLIPEVIMGFSVSKGIPFLLHVIFALDKLSAESLSRANITCNKNGIPFDTEKPMITSGIRLGTQAATTRGFGLSEFKTVGELITKTLKGLSENPSDNSKIEEEVKNEVISLTSSFPIYKNL